MTKKIGKKGLVGLSILIIAGVAIAGTFGYFVNISGDVSSSVLIEYTDDGGTIWQDAEELSIVYDLSVLNGAGDEMTIDFGLHLSVDSDVPRTVYFDITLLDGAIPMTIDGSEGITIIIEDITPTVITNYTLTPDETAYFGMTISLDPMLQAGTFSMSMTIDNDEPL